MVGLSNISAQTLKGSFCSPISKFLSSTLIQVQHLPIYVLPFFSLRTKHWLAAGHTASLFLSSLFKQALQLCPLHGNRHSVLFKSDVRSLASAVCFSLNSCQMPDFWLSLFISLSFCHLITPQPSSRFQALFTISSGVGHSGWLERGGENMLYLHNSWNGHKKFPYCDFQNVLLKYMPWTDFFSKVTSSSVRSWLIYIFSEIQKKNI